MRRVRLKPKADAGVGVVNPALVGMKLHNSRHYGKSQSEAAAFSLVGLVAAEKALPYLRHDFLVNMTARVKYRNSDRAA